MMPAWAQNLPWNLITKAAKEARINQLLLAAIVQTESAGNVYASRFESHYKWLVSPSIHAHNLGISFDTEVVHQKTSWGLCQLMGGLLRELGFGDHLPKACNPSLNLQYAAMHLAKLTAKYPNLRDAIASYNAGSPRKDETGQYENQGYVTKVIAYMDSLRGPMN